MRLLFWFLFLYEWLENRISSSEYYIYCMLRLMMSLKCEVEWVARSAGKVRNYRNSPKFRSMFWCGAFLCPTFRSPEKIRVLLVSRYLFSRCRMHAAQNYRVHSRNFHPEPATRSRDKNRHQKQKSIHACVLEICVRTNEDANGRFEWAFRPLSCDSVIRTHQRYWINDDCKYCGSVADSERAWAGILLDISHLGIHMTSTCEIPFRVIVNIRTRFYARLLLK